MYIRFAKDQDLAAIVRFHRQTIRQVNSKDYPPEMIKVWSARPSAKKLRSSADQCKRWVAVEDGKIVGYCDHNLQGEFWGLYIHKDYIGQGIGSRLLKTAEQSLQKMGFKKINIEASITAKNFYRKHGYKVIRKTTHRMGTIDLPIYVMTKRIGNAK